MGLLFYRLHRYQISDVRMGRLLVIFLLAIGGAASAGLLPGNLWLAVACLFLLLGYFGAGIYWQRKNYLHFVALPKPDIQPKRLDPSDKIPVIASGLFGVEGKYRHFTWLEGYFRTFATREHALLCLVKPDRIGMVATWPERDVGMWYIFIKDNAIQDLRWGTLSFGKREMTAVAVDHKIVIPKKGRFSRERILHKTAYIAVSNEVDALSIYADLLWRPDMETAGMSDAEALDKERTDAEHTSALNLIQPPKPYVNGNGSHVTEQNDGGPGKG